jgi:hypothetical protein
MWKTTYHGGVKLTDGDGHPEAIKELKAITARNEPVFSQLVGALIQKRHDVLDRGALDEDFYRHELPGDQAIYEFDAVSGRAGLVAIFTIVKARLILLSVVAFDHSLKEILSRRAFNEALKRATERMK